MKKLIGVAGDISIPGLGLSPEDEKALCEDVSVVFHFGANVKFDDDLQYVRFSMMVWGSYLHF